MTDFCKGISPVKFEGRAQPTRSPVATTTRTRWCSASGRKITLHPRLGRWRPVRRRTFDRPWFGKGMEGAKLKADVPGAVSTRVLAQSILLRTLGEHAPRMLTAIVAGATRRPAALPIAVHSSGPKTVSSAWVH